MHAAIECDEGSVQLVNGTNKTEGRLEVCYNEQWGTVCNNLALVMELFGLIGSSVMEMRLTYPYLSAIAD